MKITLPRIALAIGLVLVTLVGLFLYNLFGPSPAIVVSPQTTYLTEPLADDGLPDYATYLLDQQRQGVTPDNNAAIPILQALWPAEVLPEHQLVVCDEIGMRVPKQDGIIEPFTNDDVERAVKLWLLAQQGITPEKPVTTSQEFEDFKAKWREHEWERQAAETPDELEPDEPAADAIGSEFDEWEFGFGGESRSDAFDDADEIAAELIFHAMDNPWRREQLPPLGRWIDHYAREFDLLHEAARRPKCYMPSASLLIEPDRTSSLIATLLPHVQAMRSGTRVLNMRAILRLGEGDHAGAWADIEAMYRLADHTDDSTIVGQLVRIACHGLANQTTLTLLNADKLPREVAQSAHDFLRQRTSSHELGAVVGDSERLICITTILSFINARGSDSALTAEDLGAEGFSAMNSFSIDWNQVLESLNSKYDQLSKAMSLRDDQHRYAALQQIELGFDSPAPGDFASAAFSRQRRNELVADLMTSLFLPSVSASLATEDRSNAQLQLVQVAAALAVHRAETSDYPKSLDALVPKLLSKMPVDLYHQKPLVYQKRATRATC